VPQPRRQRLERSRFALAERSDERRDKRRDRPRAEGTAFVRRPHDPGPPVAGVPQRPDEAEAFAHGARMGHRGPGHRKSQAAGAASAARSDESRSARASAPRAQCCKAGMGTGMGPGCLGELPERPNDRAQRHARRGRRTVEPKPAPPTTATRTLPPPMRASGRRRKRVVRRSSVRCRILGSGIAPFAGGIPSRCR
jgi:hypothetical protein